MDKLIRAATLKVGQQFSADQCNSWWQVEGISTFRNGDVSIKATLVSKWACDACQAKEAHTDGYCNTHGKQVPPTVSTTGYETYLADELVQVHT